MNTTTASNDDATFQRNMMTSFIQIAALVILVGYCLMIVGPFTSIIVWGVILAVAIFPLHQMLSAKIGGNDKWAATIIVLVGLVVLLGPGWLAAESVIGTAKSTAADIKAGTFTIPPPNEGVADWPLVGEKLYEAWSDGAQNLQGFLHDYEPQLKAAGQWFLGAAGSVLSGLGHFTASIIIAGFLMLYSRSGYDLCCRISNRIVAGSGDQMTDLSISTIRSVTNGVLGVAFIQAVLAGIGFALIGMPAAGLFALIILLTAIIQIPAIIIMLPLIIWVFSFADGMSASIFAIYSILVALSDNVLKPLLLGRGVNLPVLVVLLGAIGGMIKFGVIGLFIGAVILGLGYQIITMWIWREQAGESADGEESAA